MCVKAVMGRTFFVIQITFSNNRTLCFFFLHITLGSIFKICYDKWICTAGRKKHYHAACVLLRRVVLTCATSELDVMVGCGKQPPNSACFRLVSLNHLLAGVITASILSHTRILPIREEAAHHPHPLNMQFIKPATASRASHINGILWRDEAFTRFMLCCQMNSHRWCFFVF